MKKDNHLKKIIEGIFVYYLIFICVSWLTFWIKGSVPDTLIQVGLGGPPIELICTTIIEVAKKKYDQREEDQ